MAQRAWLINDVFYMIIQDWQKHAPLRLFESSDEKAMKLITILPHRWSCYKVLVWSHLPTGDKTESLQEQTNT